MHAEAREVSGEFGGRWRITVSLGVFYAVPAAGIRPGCTPVPEDASTAAELRQRLRMRESLDEWAARDAARREARP